MSGQALCVTCFQRGSGCYCPHIRRFDPKIKFVILIHPIERKRRIATGRMSHLSLEGSELILGEEYSDNVRVNELLKDDSYHPVILYPGAGSVDLSAMTAPERARLFPERDLLVFVIDGTWSTARKMIRRSSNLIGLPRICFSPAESSRFVVRRQPAHGCYSTIEAIHEVIDLLGEARGFNTASRAHDGLLSVLQKMVDRQLSR